MTLEGTFYLSQMIASVAVVGSLIYLALQVRYAERSQRGIMQQGRADRVANATLHVAQADLAAIWRRGSAGDATLSREEFAQWMLLCRAIFLSGEDSFLQHQAGLLSEASFESYVAGVRYFLSGPGFRAAWRVSSGQFCRQYREFIDSVLAQSPPVPATDAYTEWRQLVQSERGSPPA